MVRVTIRWVVGALALAFCAAAVVKYWGEFTSYDPELSVGMLIVGLAIMLTGALSKATGWFVLMACLGNPIRFLTALRSWSYSQIASFIPGKVPVLVVRVQTCQEDGASPDMVFAGTVLEIIISLVSTLSIWLLSLLFVPVNDSFNPALYLIPLILLAASLHPRFIMAVMGFYYRLRGAAQDREVPHITPASILKPGILYFLGWLLSGFGGYFILKSVATNLTMPWSLSICVAGAFSFAWVVGYMFFISPGGLGAREGALIWALESFTPMGVAVVVSVLARLCQVSLGLCFAALLWLVYHLKKDSS
jgi:hypothetical protein